MAEIVAHGAWKSPIDAELVARHDGRPGWLTHAAGSLWWVSPRPGEAGRVALMRRRGETDEVVLPAPWSVRSRVHEYGGRAYAVIDSADPSVVFSEYSDQRLYVVTPGVHDEPRPLTPVPERPSGLRYVEPLVAPGGDEVWCIREEHYGASPTDVRRAIVAVPLDGSAAVDPAAVRIVVADQHFLACPRISPDARRLSWIGWDHPDMPWDSTRLRVATLDAGVAGPPVTLAGGPDQSVVQAEWSAPDTLVYAGDASGWWNLYRLTIDDGLQAASDPVPLCPRDEEFGGALWQLGMQWFAVLEGGDVATVHGRAATALGVVSASTGALQDADSPGLTEWAATLASDGQRVWGVAGGPEEHARLASVRIDDLRAEPVSAPSAAGTAAAAAGTAPAEADVDRAYLPRPEARTFVAANGRDVHASLYPPRNPDATAPAGEKPPWVVFVHGGPTSRASMVYDLEIAYFTSRGIGVVEVNYGGSTGHGREYRNRLRENWGVVDVDDCAAVALALVHEGLADASRLAIRGGSAGGWTSAAALTFTDVFACGVVLYPILDLAGWRTGETHDFESQYLESLVGPWPATKQRYHDRSPSNFPERITAPFLLLQGLEDEICPPVQAERFVELVAGRGVPHAYLTFEGEQHGFRRAETIVRALEAELSLYGQVFGFQPEGVEPVELST